jgi:excisionase family DNA binding protein
VSGQQKPAIPWYFVCENCNCKFFNDVSPCDCPRCGETLVSTERIQPPWRIKLHTVEETAEILKCSQSTVYELINKKEIGSHRCPGLRISDEMITEYLEKTRREASEPVGKKRPAPRLKLKHVKL